MQYQTCCARHGSVGVTGTFAEASAANEAHRKADAEASGTGVGYSTQVLAVCPNCRQFRRYGDCFHECAARGFAPIEDETFAPRVRLQYENRKRHPPDA